ncbi:MULTISPECIES: hypothetical protein [Pseudoxanthomonas]|jgi:DUF4097 and DUF4098 domain-containing protein YvlB|uniref:Polymer-forming cytoskeletal protein n=1 Tax=Pseudoxanthomonas mexicana TaxID=128785 RepID=A0A7G9TEX9_PSEMX|nr:MULTISPECIES: hypothetical protein [Pseudoxanthomonas]MCH2092663.1 hypothetical protein [Pseudoxanthomonas sp.]QNN78654.1 hypothetical protein IAE60_04250 [Pseudoxanthomonas mexicana]
MTRTRTALLLTLALATTPALAQQDVSKVNGSVSADAGQAYGDLETVNGSVSIAAGATVEDASTVNGSITVGDKAQAASLETVNGAIRIGKDVQVRKDVETVNGSIFTDRGTTIGGNVDTVNGAIGLVGTQLAGGIETVNGDITVGIGSHVKGGIKVEKPRGWSMKPRRDPRIIIGPNAVVEGPLVFERPVTLYVHTSARIGAVTGATAKPFSTDTAPTE